MSIDAVKERIKALGRDDVLERYRFGKIATDDPVKLEKIALGIIAGFDRHEEHTHSWTPWRFRVGSALYIEQNGLCIYDDFPMIGYGDDNRDIRAKHHPRMATIEHLQRVHDGGTNNIKNLRLACSICNSLRGQLHMEVDEFKLWARQHPDSIEVATNIGYAKWIVQNLTTLSEWIFFHNNPDAPSYVEIQKKIEYHGIDIDATRNHNL